MTGKKWALIAALLVGGTFLIPRNSQGMLGIAFYMIALYTLLDHYRHELNQYMKVLFSLLGSGVLAYVVITFMSFFL